MEIDLIDIQLRKFSEEIRPEDVFNTWVKIWADEELNARRTYRADFTVHGNKYFDGDQAEVETFISVKA